MRGRDIFKLFKPVLRCITKAVGFLPKSILNWFLISLRYTTGIKGIGLRYIFLKAIAKSCDDNVSVHDSVFFKYTDKISFGKNISIHPLCYIDGQGNITIGDNVSIAHNVSMLSFEHDFSDVNKPIKDAPCIPQEIIIEDDVWVGAGVRVLGGVRIGTGSVIGAGAVVTKDIPPYSIAVGVPAKVVSKRKES